MGLRGARELSIFVVAFEPYRHTHTQTQTVLRAGFKPNIRTYARAQTHSLCARAYVAPIVGTLKTTHTHTQSRGVV